MKGNAQKGKPELADVAAEWVHVDELRPWEKNPRKNDPAVPKVAESIRRFGFVSPIVVWQGGNRMVAGHTRLKAMRALMKESPDFVAKGAPAPGMVRVAFHEFADEHEADVYALADNRLGETADWDEDALGEILRGMSDDELAVSGFEREDEAPEVLGEDVVSEPPVEPVTKRGDVWLLGRHRLVCGSCADEGVVRAAVGDSSVSVCLTDPPYGLGDTVSDKNDYRTYEDSAENLDALIAGFLPLARSVAPVVVLTPGNGNAFRYPTPTWTMAWFTPAGVGRGPWGFCCWQPILCFGKDPKLSRGKGCHPDALVHTESSEDFGHPCTKPIGFWTWLMERVSEPGDVVFEPFCGSGTTVVAAERLGRTCVAVELDPAYCDVTVARWESLTGKKATRIMASESGV